MEGEQVISDTLRAAREFRADAVAAYRAMFGPWIPRGVYWASWGLMDRVHFRELKASGCGEVIVNANRIDASRFDWMGGRPRVLRLAENARLEGHSIGLMPYVPTLDPGWAALCGRKCAAWIDDMGGVGETHVRQVQLDVEGHGEKDGARRARIPVQMHYTRYTAAQWAALARVVDAFMIALLTGYHDWRGDTDSRPLLGLAKFGARGGLVLGLTTLYYRRAVGDLLAKGTWTIRGITYRIGEHLPQAYSREGDGDQVWHREDLQPGPLQRKTWNTHRDLAPYLDVQGLGLNGWDLERTGEDWPEHMRLTAPQAMDRMLEECRALGVPQIAIWGPGHLADERDDPIEAARFDLHLAAYERWCALGQRVDPEHQTPTPEPEPEPGVTIDWAHARVIEGLERGGLPAGFVLPKHYHPPLSVAPYVHTAGVILTRWHRLRREAVARGETAAPPLAWVVPFTDKAGRSCRGVVCHHTWTPDGRGGHKDFDGAGCTVGIARLSRSTPRA